MPTKSTDTSANLTRQAKLLDQLNKATAAKELAVREILRATGTEGAAIRAAYSAGVGATVLSRNTGMSRGRIYQILGDLVEKTR